MALTAPEAQDQLTIVIANALGKKELEDQLKDPESGEESDRMPGTPDGATAIKINEQISTIESRAGVISLYAGAFIYAVIKEMIETGMLDGVEWTGG